MPDIDERFTVDKGDGNGYEVYYRKGNGCWWYTVTYDDIGCRSYSRSHRLPRKLYEEMKEKRSDKD